MQRPVHVDLRVAQVARSNDLASTWFGQVATGTSNKPVDGNRGKADLP